MNELMNFYRVIVETNTFNFAILLIIFAVIYHKMNIADTIEKIRQDVISAIENAKLQREDAKSKLSLAKKSIENIDIEIKTQLDEASKRAKDLSGQILANAELQVKAYEKNIERSIESEEKSLSSKAADKTLKLSVELAKRHIKTMLKNNPELHNKFIEESIGVL